MRVALLSALADPPGTPGINGASAGERPAFRRFAGKSVLSHQIDCAAHLGCSRVLCMAGGPGPDLGAAKAYAERSGMRFETVDSIALLTTKVTAAEELVVIADGVLPDRVTLVEALAERAGVLAFPDQPAVQLGFERLDATRAWSGVLRTRGDNVARLADLPSDCDAASSLLRIALHSGVGVIEIDPAPLSDGTWQRRVDRQVGAAAEWRWIARQVQPAPFAAPGLAIVQRLGLRWAHDLGASRWARTPQLAAVLSAVLVVLAIAAGWPVAGLCLLLAGSCALAVADIADRVERLGSRLGSHSPVMAIAEWLRDGLLAGCLSLPIMAVPGWLSFVLPLVLVGLLRVGAVHAAPRLRPLIGDRIVLIAGLIPVVYLGWTTVAVAGLTLFALAALLWAARAPKPRLTAD